MGELGHTGCYGGFNHDLINPRGFIDLTYGFMMDFLGPKDGISLLKCLKSKPPGDGWWIGAEVGGDMVSA